MMIIYILLLVIIFLLFIIMCNSRERKTKCELFLNSNVDIANM